MTEAGTFCLRQKQDDSRLTVLLAWLIVCLALLSGPACAELHWDEPPGLMVDLGSHRLHLYCAGEGSPTVVIDAGLGASALEWLPIVERLRKHQRTCLYDRAGYAWSDPGPEPRTSRRIADELAQALEHAAIPRPYVLVGHSFGGFNMQLFASLHADRTAGLVLVDASHPGQAQRFAQPPLNLNTAPTNRRGLPVFSEIQVPEKLPQELRELAMAFLMMPKTRHVIGQEYVNMRISADQVDTAPALPPVPLMVLTRGRGSAARNLKAMQIEDVWLELQAGLAARSPYAAHIVAEKSGHHIHLDQPELVADAITLIVDVARTSLSPSPPQREPHWLAFRNARWLKDELPDAQTLDPALRGRLAQNGPATVGRMALPATMTR